ncbi:UNVERIFIED_CONTAM: hypothetical protein RMT77_013063 [Armadillidium vulgare]
MNAENGPREHLSNSPGVSLHRTRKRKKYENFIHLLRNRELQEKDWRIFSKKTQISPSAIERLGVIDELQGHCGCVNCIEFNEPGDLLLSGSDDFKIILWNVHRKKLLRSLSTGHRGNIFSVKFLPHTNDNLIVSGAGDHRLEVREISSGEATQVCTCHSERVKRIATVSSSPTLFFSASEDGTIMQFDTRTKHSCTSQPNNILINLKQHAGRFAECKCVTVHPLRPELIAVGASDPYIRVYDRRMINLTSIQYPPGASVRSSWDRWNYATSKLDSSIDNIPPGCVQFYVPGHLPAKMREFHRKYRSLATTYLSYDADGTHLLANLGGDHIYLFDTLNAKVPKEYTKPLRSTSKIPKSAYLVAQPNGVCNIVDPTNGYSSQSLFCQEETGGNTYSPLDEIPPEVEALRLKAHDAFNKQEYTTALELYNSAIQCYDNIAVLYSARAATLIRRNWDGDIYAALRDCNRAIDLDPDHVKAKFRQVKCLELLGRNEESHQCLFDLIDEYPQIELSGSWLKLRDKVSNPATNNHNNTEGSDSEREDEGFIAPSITDKEKLWRENAKDYEKVFCGHCNTTTDIKEAVFIGRNCDLIAAGSDDGNLFIWDRKTTNLVRVIEADKSIVNCVQSHPSVCMLATSGIETVVKLWGPVGKEEDIDHTSSEKVLKITHENQQRMSTDPMEMMFLQMGDIMDGGHIFARRRGDVGHDFEGAHLSGQCRQA